jgi:hypothetical protein
MASIDNVSLTLNGVTNITQSSRAIVETAIESHSVEYIKSMMLVTFLNATVNVTSITTDDSGEEAASRRKLRPMTSCTITFSETFFLRRMDGAKDLDVSTFATLPFKTQESRSQFALNFRNLALASEDSGIKFATTWSVSPMIIPPISSPSLSPTPAIVSVNSDGPTLADKNGLWVDSATSDESSESPAEADRENGNQETVPGREGDDQNVDQESVLINDEATSGSNAHAMSAVVAFSYLIVSVNIWIAF